MTSERQQSCVCPAGILKEEEPEAKRIYFLFPVNTRVSASKGKLRFHRTEQTQLGVPGAWTQTLSELS